MHPRVWDLGAVATHTIRPPMAGRRQARPPLPAPPEEHSPLEPTAPREAAVAEEMRRSKKTCHASSSTSSSATSDVWAHLLDSLLHQVLAVLSSFHDLLALVGTCRSWRAALSSAPPAFSFSFPPLHLQPDADLDPRPRRSHVKQQRRRPSSNRKWKLVDPATTKRTSSSLRCLAVSPPSIQAASMRYLGCSYGHLIISNSKQCLLVDAYSGDTVRPPKLNKSTANHEVYYGVLSAPTTSPGSCLLLCSRSSVFRWQVGTGSWLEHPLDCDERILRIVFFKGEMLAMDFHKRLHRIHLAPQLVSVQEVAVTRAEDMLIAGLQQLLFRFEPWLVVCGDTLLLVDLSVIRDGGLSDCSATFRAFRLESAAEPAAAHKWVQPAGG